MLALTRTYRAHVCPSLLKLHEPAISESYGGSIKARAEIIHILLPQQWGKMVILSQSEGVLHRIGQHNARTSSQALPSRSVL